MRIESLVPPDAKAAVSTLPSAMLLAATGGILDAVVYLDHGHVFANAMTGNVVLLGIAMVTGAWQNILPHLTPILIFLCGVLASHLLKALPVHRVTLAALILEAAALLVVGSLPHSFPPIPFVGIVTFVSAFQVTTFRRVGDFNYNSTFTTGNLRDAAEGLYAALTEPDPKAASEGRQKFHALASICACFLLGAVLGAWAAPRLANHAFYLTEPLLVTVILFVLLHPAAPDASTPSR